MYVSIVLKYVCVSITFVDSTLICRFGLKFGDRLFQLGLSHTTAKDRMQPLCDQKAADLLATDAQKPWSLIGAKF